MVARSGRPLLSVQQALERALGGTVTTFAYSFAACDARAIAATSGAGFTGACTVAGRLARFLRKLWFGAAA